MNFKEFNKKYTNILVTGGAGFIGGALIARLLKYTDSKIYNLDSLEVLNNLFKRERLGSTVVGNGIAIPHVVDNLITEPKGLISILSKGINFDSLDNIPVDIVVLLFFPANKKTEYLQILASISRLLRNSNLTNKLRGCKSQESAFATFSQIIEYKAA